MGAPPHPEDEFFKATWDLPLPSQPKKPNVAKITSFGK